MSSQSRFKVGFTLVELLVVIAIIGILIAMLLPAVQQVREASRRAVCLNNLKQIGMAIQNYHSTFDSFPVGASPSANGSFGYSWWVKTLPFIEMNNIHDQLDFDPSRQWGWSGNVPGAGNTNNHRILFELALPMGRCPSSPLPVFSWPYAQSFSPTYAGIAGAFNHPTVVNVGSTTGDMSLGGLLIRNKTLGMNDAIDGTSNTVIVGEQSDYCRDAAGTEQDGRSDAWHGFQMGANGSNFDLRAYNITTVRHRLNEKSFNAIGVGQSFNHGANRPIQSVHPGGANVAIADGSSRFLKESINIQTFYNLANRDDGKASSFE